MNEEEQKAMEYIKNIKSWWWDNSPNRCYVINKNDIEQFDIILNLITNQQKEKEEKTTIIMAGAEKVKNLEKEIKTLKGTHKEFLKLHQMLKIEDTLLGADNILNAIEKNYISKDKIKKILGIEEEMTEEQILSYIDILVSENNRLEDIEDRKVQVAVDNIEKKRDKYWQEKIKNKIKELKKMKLTKGDIFFKMRNYAILILRELLEK